jgi:hypothetical protein
MGYHPGANPNEIFNLMHASTHAQYAGYTAASKTNQTVAFNAATLAMCD